MRTQTRTDGDSLTDAYTKTGNVNKSELMISFLGFCLCALSTVLSSKMPVGWFTRKDSRCCPNRQHMSTVCVELFEWVFVFPERCLFRKQITPNHTTTKHTRKERKHQTLLSGSTILFVCLSCLPCVCVSLLCVCVCVDFVCVLTLCVCWLCVCVDFVRP